MSQEIHHFSVWMHEQPSLYLLTNQEEELELSFSQDPEMKEIFGDWFPEGTQSVEYPVHTFEKVVGHLPLVIRCLYEEIASVNFSGFHPKWVEYLPGTGTRFFISSADPLVIAPLDQVAIEKAQIQRSAGAAYTFAFAADPYFKDYTGGATSPYRFIFPRTGIDAEMDNPYAQSKSFIDYLRGCFRWGGFPGMSTWERVPQENIAYVTRNLLPF